MYRTPFTHNPRHMLIIVEYHAKNTLRCVCVFFLSAQFGSLLLLYGSPNFSCGKLLMLLLLPYATSLPEQLVHDLVYYPTIIGQKGEYLLAEINFVERHQKLLHICSAHEWKSTHFAYPSIERFFQHIIASPNVPFFASKFAHLPVHVFLARARICARLVPSLSIR